MADDTDKRDDDLDEGDEQPPFIQRRRVERIPGPLDAVDVVMPKYVFIGGVIVAAMGLIFCATTVDSYRWYFLIISMIVIGSFSFLFWQNWSGFTYALREIEKLNQQIKNGAIKPEELE